MQSLNHHATEEQLVTLGTKLLTYLVAGTDTHDDVAAATVSRTMCNFHRNYELQMVSFLHFLRQQPAAQLERAACCRNDVLASATQWLTRGMRTASPEQDGARVLVVLTQRDPSCSQKALDAGVLQVRPGSGRMRSPRQVETSRRPCGASPTAHARWLTRGCVLLTRLVEGRSHLCCI